MVEFYGCTERYAQRGNPEPEMKILSLNISKLKKDAISKSIIKKRAKCVIYHGARTESDGRRLNSVVDIGC